MDFSYKKNSFLETSDQYSDIPAAKTLREKIRLLIQNDQASQRGGELSQDWMEMFPESICALYIDGHVRVYNGSQTELPRHYVARQKLGLRATADYWVNSMDGQPFFMVNKAVDLGLLTVLEKEIVPRPVRSLMRGVVGAGGRKNPASRFILRFATLSQSNLIR